MIKENFIKLYENSFRGKLGFTLLHQLWRPESYTYGEVAKK